VADAEAVTVTVPAIATVQVESVFGPLSTRVLAVGVGVGVATAVAVEIVVDGARLVDQPVDVVVVVAAEAGAAEAAAAAPDAKAAVA
jgi:hypothetical protein